MSESISRSHENDLISRRAAIKAVLKGRISEDNSLVECVEECNAMIEWACDVVLKNLPSAQPELAQDLPNACTDAISRQAAINALREEFKKSPTTAIRAMSAIKILPSAQPEHTCETCRYNKRTWDMEPCDSCTIGGEDSHYEPSAQPETPPYVAEIESEYKKCVSMPHINKPLAKALYEVWKRHDREDVSRNG